MRLKFVLLSAVIHLAAGRFAFVPKFYAQDSAIIVDTDKQLPQAIEGQRTALRPYPMYHLVPPQLKAPATQRTANATLAAEYPGDLLEIARSKLGIQRLEDIPSIGKLSELLGTASADETIQYIRQLTANEQGIALMKAYIDSGDYTDAIDDNAESANSTTTTTTTTTTTEAPQNLPAASKKNRDFVERMAAYMHVYNFLPHHKEKLFEAASKAGMRPPQRTPAKPLLLLHRQPLPFHYPVPLRPLASSHRPPAIVHLNTPRSMAPLHRQLAKFTNIPAKKLHAFLQSKPKLAELADKISRIPMTHARNSTMDAQLIVAVQKAIEQDEDLKKLLSSAETLK